MSARPAIASPDVTTVYELLGQWQLEDALVLAEEILLADPDNPQAWAMAARVQHHRGEHLSALALYEAAARAGEADSEHFRGLVETGARHQAHFETHETAHFKIRYLNKDEIVAKLAAPGLESAYRNLAGDLGLLPAERGEKIVVEIFPSARGLANATGLTVNEIETSGTIAVCKFHRLMIISPLATASGYDWADTLAHEFAHLVISKKSRNTIPIWLHEGIAKFYESRWKGKVGEALTPYGEKLLAQATHKNDFVTFAQMHPSMAKLPSQEMAALAFAEVFTTIEFLRQRFGADAIPKLLDRASKGDDLERVLKDVFGMGLGQIEKNWRRYLKKRKFRDIPGAAPRPIRLVADEEAAKGERPLEKIEDRQVHEFSRLGELLQLRGHHQAAIIEYEKAYARAGMRYVTVVNRLARAYIEVKRTKDALRILQKILEAHSSDGDAHLLAGRIHLKQKNLNGARRHFEAVRMQNPFNPEAHMALARIYEEQGDDKAAEQAKRFLRMASAPRPTRVYDLPARPAGNAFVSIVTPKWGHIRINGRMPIASPAWDVPVEAGEVSVEVLPTGSLHTFDVGPGESVTRVLR